MKSKKELLKESRLYLIVDKDVCSHTPLVKIINKIKDKGVNIVQFRDKDSKKEDILENAREFRKLLLNTPNIFIINDYLDVAKIVDSDGIHLGQNDLSLQRVRRILGKDKIIGVSCHNLSQAIIAQANGADYISIGPIFRTPTKPKAKPIGLELLKEIRKNIKIPFFAIGGINLNNIETVLSYGAKGIAVCRAICKARNPFETIKSIKDKLNNR